VAGSFVQGSEPLGSIKLRNFSNQQVLASQEGLCSM